MIIGAGKIAYYLLNILQDVRRKIDLKVLEVNRERAEFFSQEFPDLYVVHGDGTAKDILLEESANNFDAVATLTGVDEENIITSMFLDSVGVKKEHYQGQSNQSVGDHWRSGYDQYRYAKTHCRRHHYALYSRTLQCTVLKPRSPAPCRKRSD